MAMTGYDVGSATLYNKAGKLRASEKEMLSCQRCDKLLRDPMQLITCGCRYCKSCVKTIIGEMKTSEAKMKCPRDGEVFEKSDVRIDRGCQKEIDSLEVDCPTQPTPCTWRGSLKLVEEHLRENCPKVVISCKYGCGVEYPRSCQEWHINNECPKRPVPCQHCKATVPFEELQDHYASCPSHPIKCNYCDVALSMRSELPKHLDEVCNEYEMVCPMEPKGCDFKGKREEMTKHVNQTHTIIAFEMITANAKEVEQVKSVNSQLTEENKQLREDNKKITIENQRLARKFQELEQQLKRLDKVFQQQHKRRPELVEADGYHEPVTSKSRYAAASKASFGDDSGYNSNSAMSVSKLRDDVDNQQSQLVQLGDNVQVMQENFTQFSIALDEIRLRQDVLEVKATNGVFIWKIPDIRRRYRDAVDRKTISLYSPPFYTSPHGYRMCIRVYLNGDGLGKGTHISVFFVLMKSEHDCLLSWPFKQSVRFTLINQINQANSISEAFAPDLSSPSFQQPTGEMNVASGFPKFVRQSILQNEEFTQGNAIYIKAQVDLSGLTQT